MTETEQSETKNGVNANRPTNALEPRRERLRAAGRGTVRRQTDLWVIPTLKREHADT